MSPSSTIDLLNLSSYDYDLPASHIATEPLVQRDHSKMMVVNRANGTISHHHFYDLPNILNTGDLLVMNNTQVLPCRVFGQRENTKTGELHTGKVECLFLQPEQGNPLLWTALCKPSRKLPLGTRIHSHNAVLTVVEQYGQGKALLQAELPKEFTSVVDWLNAVGSMPIPPYLGREATKADNTTYQTTFAKPHQQLGRSQAAPTAGLHMTPDVQQALANNGVNTTECTLTVSTGTFREVASDDITQHKMDAEHYDLPASAVKEINTAKDNGNHVIAIGTTATKTIETAYRQTALSDGGSGILGAHQGWSKLFIYPGIEFHVVDGLLTNFHLPKSTLMMLVSAFASRDLIMEAYQQAIEHNYRFYSYGDCMLIL